jgi:putative ABC transport system permease protein
LFGLVASIVAGVLFGLVPAIRASRVDLIDSLKDAGKSTDGRARHGLRNVLVSMELALAFVLVVGAGLLGNSFLRLLNVNSGFDPHNVLTASTYVYGARYQKPEAELGLYQQVFERLRATPGVESIGMVSTLPLGGSFDRTGFHVQDRPLQNPSEAPSVDRYSVSPEYFQVMRIALLRGRRFTDQDRMGAPPTAIISDSCARSQFPGQDPIGKRVQLDGRDESKPWATVVGVVGDVRQYGLDRAPNMAVYIPQAQNLNFGYVLVARTTMDPRRLAGAVRAAFLEADKTQPIYDVKPLEDWLGSSLAQRSFTLALLGLFGALALVLAAVGIYGVITYAVSLRTRELGIRMALGAQRKEVLRMVLLQGAALTGWGLLAGLTASLLLTRFLGSMLYGVKSWDIATSFVVAIILAMVALIASYVPARRATKVDPMMALRYE